MVVVYLDKSSIPLHVNKLYPLKRGPTSWDYRECSFFWRYDCIASQCPPDLRPLTSLKRFARKKSRKIWILSIYIIWLYVDICILLHHFFDLCLPSSGSNANVETQLDKRSRSASSGCTCPVCSFMALAKAPVVMTTSKAGVESSSLRRWSFRFSNTSTDFQRISTHHRQSSAWPAAAQICPFRTTKPSTLHSSRFRNPRGPRSLSGLRMELHRLC